MKNKEVLSKSKKDHHISEKEREQIKKEIFKEISATLKAGGNYKVRDFGTFSISKHKPRKGVNPKTGAKIMIPAKNAIKFSISKNFKREIQPASSMVKPKTIAR